MSSKSKHLVPIHHNVNGFTQLTNYLKTNSFSKLFVLTDENTEHFCLPILEKNLITSFHLLKITSGEVFKTLETCQFLWQELAKLGADRQSILINLGGGVITDMGGFVAATYKRGIRFINIPTTLLGMVDASIGGKTGVDFEHLKNQIGLFVDPEMLCIYPYFLKTLSERELLSGLAEVIKYGLIENLEIWHYIKDQTPKNFEINAAIVQKSIAIKERITSMDPGEKGIRKTLNFGHTLGHAIETHFLSKQKKEHLLHGEAVAIGMILATHLSYQTQGLPIEIVKEITCHILKFYTNTIPAKISNKEYHPIIEFLQHDKKNDCGNVNFVLLKAIGKPLLDCRVTNDEIFNAFDYYNSFPN